MSVTLQSAIFLSHKAAVIARSQHSPRGALRQLISFMIEDPRTISPCLDLVFIAKSLERVGDHAKNISEYVIYTVKGKDVRHTSPEEIERAAES